MAQLFAALSSEGAAAVFSPVSPPRPRPARVLTGIICPVLAGVLVMCTDGASCHPLMISAGTYTLMDLAASLKQITLMLNTIFSALSVVHPYTITV